MITLHQDIRYWLALTAVPNIGIQTLLKTAQATRTSLSGLGSLTSSELEKIAWKPDQIACLQEPHPFTQKCIHWLSAGANRCIISYDCDEYPLQLKQIAQAPLILFCDGDYRLLSRPQLAVVGSRGPTHSGLMNTRVLIEDLVLQSDIVITSGLALGIDAQSHQAALGLSAKSIGVLGNGIDIVYPKRHVNLYQQLKKYGLLVSEFPPSIMPSPKLFPRRNRIISGLSLGTLVVEAKIKSGSLVTAKYALEHGREVFAVPSSISNNEARGCHWLIKQGAKLTENAKDILDELPLLTTKVIQNQAPEKKPKQRLATAPLLDSVDKCFAHIHGFSANKPTFYDPIEDEQQDKASLVLQAVDYDVTSIDVIATRTGESISTLLIQLLEYELRGFVASTSEGYLKLRG
jgi:DNA processing protein